MVKYGWLTKTKTMPKKLSDIVVAQRMQELRNARRLLKDSRQREIAKDARIKQLETIVLNQQSTIDKQQIQIAELQTMVFGKKRRPPTGHHEPVNINSLQELRSKDSYRRPLPPASAITKEEPVPLSDTCSCGGRYTHITEHIRYEEDIPLPDLTKDYQAHLVTKYVIERGVCRSCGKASAERELGGQIVSLGSNVRLLICHLVSVMGLSYAK